MYLGYVVVDKNTKVVLEERSHGLASIRSFDIACAFLE